MSTKNSRRKGQEKNRKGRLSEKSSSFHGQSAEDMVGKMVRPRTVPDLLSGHSTRVGISPQVPPKLTKLLLNVTIQRSLGAVQVVMSQENTVGDLIAAALRQFSKEGRRSIFPSLDPSGFDLHYSQFSLESLEPKEKLMALGSRNFFLCPKKWGTANGAVGVGGVIASPSSPPSCSKQADKATNVGSGWFRFMDFLL